MSDSDRDVVVDLNDAPSDTHPRDPEDAQRALADVEDLLRRYRLVREQARQESENLEPGRQVLVEQTGFEYDIVLQVYDGRTGELLYTDNFKDFKQLEGEKADPLQGMFENLYSLEDRIVGVFAQKTVEASRVLLTD